MEAARKQTDREAHARDYEAAGHQKRAKVAEQKREHRDAAAVEAQARKEALIAARKEEEVIRKARDEQRRLAMGKWIPKTQAELDADFWCWVDKQDASRDPHGGRFVLRG